MLAPARFCFNVTPFLISLILIYLTPSCNNPTIKAPKETSISSGEKLARSYCSSCHQFPEPSLLDKKSWEQGVLPHMGPMLGIYEFNYQRYPANIGDANLPKGFYPAQPALQPGEWENIIKYYTTSSPDSLSIPARKTKTAPKLPLFTVRAPAIRYNDPSTSFVKIEHHSAENDLLVCDLFKQNLYRFNKHLDVVDSMFSSGAIVDIDFQREGMLTCNIGTFNPTNNKYGEARYIRTTATGKFEKDKQPLFKDLTRPVQIEPADLNKDGKTDYVVCEFGYLAGALSWMENTGNNKFERHVLRPVPGAVRVCVGDYNKDGLTDILALFAQGEEGVFIFTNKGNGTFDQQEVLRFPPSYGSSYFELDDFNKDGHPDILYTCGDNADYSTILKPYHGVYIFMNDGSNHFDQKYFFPLNGCYKAVARDFDNDGDLDIAAIAYFADYARHPEEGFVYLKNEGNFSFKPYELAGTETGRWMTMDAGDIDGDGRIDLVLGNFSTGPVSIRSKIKWEEGPPFILLKNTGKEY